MAGPRSYRVESIDLARGLIMVIMALDHVRDHFMGYAISPTDLARATPWLFATRWASHFCAPGFFLTAGIGAYLSQDRWGDVGKLRRFLLTRGAWLMVLEVAFVNVMFMAVPTEVYLQTFWALGWSMVALAGLSYLPVGAIGVAGATMILSHNAFDGVRPCGVWGAVWGVLHVQGEVRIGAVHAHVHYPLVPWVGVMAVGYALGPLFAGGAARDPLAERKSVEARAGRAGMLAWLAGTCALGFLFVRSTNLYGDPSLWSAQRTAVGSVMSFLNVTKYPPSLCYLLLTLGGVFGLLLGFERWGDAAGRRRGEEVERATRGAERIRASGVRRDIPKLPERGARAVMGGYAVARALLLDIGRVPMFFYVLHLLVINGLFAAWLVWRGGVEAIGQVYHADAPDRLFTGLGAVYVLWVIVLAALWPACRWYSRVKSTRPRWWMGYV